MNTSEQHMYKAAQGSCLLDLFLRLVVGLLGLLTVGERKEIKNRESPEVGGGGWGEQMLLSQKRIILICFDSASQRVQPTVPTFFFAG